MTYYQATPKSGLLLNGDNNTWLTTLVSDSTHKSREAEFNDTFGILRFLPIWRSLKMQLQYLDKKEEQKWQEQSLLPKDPLFYKLTHTTYSMGTQKHYDRILLSKGHSRFSSLTDVGFASESLSIYVFTFPEEKVDYALETYNQEVNEPSSIFLTDIVASNTPFNELETTLLEDIEEAQFLKGTTSIVFDEKATFNYLSPLIKISNIFTINVSNQTNEAWQNSPTTTHQITPTQEKFGETYTLPLVKAHVEPNASNPNTKPLFPVGIIDALGNKTLLK